VRLLRRNKANQDRRFKQAYDKTIIIPAEALKTTIMMAEAPVSSCGFFRSQEAMMLVDSLFSNHAEILRLKNLLESSPFLNEYPPRDGHYFQSSQLLLSRVEHIIGGWDLEPRPIEEMRRIL
jgi:F0F1-type ATP synthase alpha subunit